MFNGGPCCDAANTDYESLWLFLLMMHMFMVQNDKVMTLCLFKQMTSNDAWIDLVNCEWKPYATHVRVFTIINQWIKEIKND